MSIKTKVTILMAVCVLVSGMFVMKRVPVLTITMLGLTTVVWCIKYVLDRTKE